MKYANSRSHPIQYMYMNIWQSIRKSVYNKRVCLFGHVVMALACQQPYKTTRTTHQQAKSDLRFGI